MGPTVRNYGASVTLKHFTSGSGGRPVMKTLQVLVLKYAHALLRNVSYYAVCEFVILDYARAWLRNLLRSTAC